MEVYLHLCSVSGRAQSCIYCYVIAGRLLLTHTLTLSGRQKFNRQANAHKLVHVFAHKLTEASLFFDASQNLGPLSKWESGTRTDVWLQQGNASKKPSALMNEKEKAHREESRPFRCLIIKHPAWHWPPSGALILPFIPSNHPPRKKEKKPAALSRFQKTLKLPSSHTGRKTQQRGENQVQDGLNINLLNYLNHLVKQSWAELQAEAGFQKL